MINPLDEIYFNEQERAREVENEILQIMSDSSEDMISRLHEFIPELISEFIYSDNPNEQEREYIMQEVIKRFEKRIKITYE